jgi:type I restriction enzyme S subunit
MSGQLVEQWPIKTIGEFCKTTSGSTPSKSNKDYHTDGTIPWLLSGEVNKREITESKNFITELALENTSVKLFPPNTVLVAMYGATAGQVGILRFSSTTNQAICGILPNDKIIPEYLYYALENANSELVARASGSAQPNLSQQKIKAMSIPVPSLEEQQRIVSILDEAFANIGDSLAESHSRSHSARELYDSCTELAVNGKLVPQDPSEESGAQLLEQIIQQRENLWNLAEDEKMAVAPDRAKRGRYKQAKPTARENLPEIPSNWTWASLEELSYFVVDYRGKTPPTSETGIPIISAANVREGFVDLSPLRFVSEETYTLWSVRGEPKAGDVLITTEAPVGRTAIYPENAKYLLTRRILGARLNERCNPEYIRLCLSAGFTARRIAWHSHGATVPRILKPNLFSVPIPLPPFEEQNRIMQQIRVVSQGVNSVEEKCMVKIESLDELKLSILQEAFNGTL